MSVIVTAGERPELLSWTVDSVRAQEDADVEVLVAGPAPAAQNAALREASGVWVGFLDEGDWWRPDRVRRQLGDAATVDAAIAYAGRVAVDRAGKLVEYVLAVDPADLRQSLRVFDALGRGAGVLARAEALREAGGFDERLHVLHHRRLWIALLGTGSAVACPDVLAVELRDGTPPELRMPRRTAAELRLLSRDRLLAPGVAAGTTGDLAAELRRRGRRREAASLYLLGAMAHGRPQDLVRAGATLLSRPRPHAPVAFVAPGWVPRPPRAG